MTREERYIRRLIQMMHHIWGLKLLTPKSFLGNIKMYIGSAQLDVDGKVFDVMEKPDSPTRVLWRMRPRKYKSPYPFDPYRLCTALAEAGFVVHGQRTDEVTSTYIKYQDTYVGEIIDFRKPTN